MATSKIENFIYTSSKDSLKSLKNRKLFSANLQKICNFWSVSEIEDFVNEMRGLNFYRLEDRKIFCEFFFYSFGGLYESSCT